MSSALTKKKKKGAKNSWFHREGRPEDKEGPGWGKHHGGFRRQSWALKPRTPYSPGGAAPSRRPLGRGLSCLAHAHPASGTAKPELCLGQCQWTLPRTSPL